MKTCSKCKIEKNLTDFGKCSKSKDKLKSACKECLRSQGREYAKNKRLDEPTRLLFNEREKEWRQKKLSDNPNYYNDRYYEDHERSLQKAKRYYHNNVEICLERQKKWRENNKDVSLQSSKNWKINNPEKTKKIQKNESEKYRARKNDAIIQNFSYEELDQRMSIFGYKCCYCNGKFEHIDHLIPLSKGGRHCLSNLRPSCKQCNNKKYNKTPAIWFAEIKGNI